MYVVPITMFHFCLELAGDWDWRHVGFAHCCFCAKKSHCIIRVKKNMYTSFLDSEDPIGANKPYI